MEVPNSQMVGVRDGKIVVLFPRREMTKDEAMIHAAWLVTLADMSGECLNRFEEIVMEVRNT